MFLWLQGNITRVVIYPAVYLLHGTKSILYRVTSMWLTQYKKCILLQIIVDNKKQRVYNSTQI